MMTKELTEVRCPFKKRDKITDKVFLCNMLCVKVYAPSSGETFCSSCKLPFEFEVSNQVTQSIKVVAK